MQRESRGFRSSWAKGRNCASIGFVGHCTHPHPHNLNTSHLLWFHSALRDMWFSLCQMCFSWSSLDSRTDILQMFHTNPCQVRKPIDLREEGVSTPFALAVLTLKIYSSSQLTPRTHKILTAWPTYSLSITTSSTSSHKYLCFRIRNALLFRISGPRPHSQGMAEVGSQSGRLAPESVICDSESIPNFCLTLHSSPVQNSQFLLFLHLANPILSYKITHCDNALKT